MGGCTSSNPDEFATLAPGEVPKVKGKEADKAVKKMRGEIDKIHEFLGEQQMVLRPLLLERNGVNVMLTEQREKLMKLLARKDELFTQRAPMMEETWEKDADVIYEAFNAGFTVDKSALIDVLANRARWQINLIAEVFEKKYNVSLISQIVTNMTTMFGSLVTGSQTNLCKLLIYRILEQPERDSALLKDFISDQDVICEIFTTRSNQELRLAIEMFDSENTKTFRETITSKGYPNYRKFMNEVLELNRDESLDGFPKDEAAALADELYKAGAGRMMGADPEPFIRVFSRINPHQFESINDAYKGKKLKDDIQKKFGGDFGNALLSRCSSKYVFLAARLDTAFKGMSVDKNSISRILGCISRKEGVLVREAYDNGQFGRTLETALKTVLKKGGFQKACLSVITGERTIVADTSVFPLGSDREESEDAAEISRDGDRALVNAAQAYNADKVRAQGHPVTDEFPIPAWDASTKLFKTSLEDVTAYYQDFVKAQKDVVTYKESVSDDIVAKKDIYFAMVKHCYETEAWIRVYNSHIKALSSYSVKRNLPPPPKRELF